MTKCKECGKKLGGCKIRAFNQERTLLGFLKGHAEPGEYISQPGDPDYTTEQGYIHCGCGRKIPVTPKMLREGSKQYDEL